MVANLVVPYGYYVALVIIVLLILSFKVTFGPRK